MTTLRQIARWTAAALLAAPLLHAHSVHQSTAEAEYNAKTQKLEVSLTAFVNDLELALVRQCEREMRLDKTPATELDAQIQAYLSKTFVVTDKAGKTAKIEWVGRELDAESKKSGDPTVTLFFEMEMPTRATLRHTMFCELFKDQLNLLQLRRGSRKTELRFVPGTSATPLTPE